jgi:hypothetical protein
VQPPRTLKMTSLDRFSVNGYSRNDLTRYTGLVIIPQNRRAASMITEYLGHMDPEIFRDHESGIP